MEIIQYTNNNASKNITHNNQDVISFGFVSYNKNAYEIVGEYSNELLLFRAKKFWKAALLDTFLLEYATDFKLKVKRNSKNSIYHLICTFHSACGRYAFWRINNDQNPEVRYIIETAHQTQTADNYDKILNKFPKFTILTDQSLICDIEDQTSNISDVLKK